MPDSGGVPERLTQLAMNRRAVLSSAAVASALTFPSVSLASAAVLPVEARAVFDRRFPQARAFAEQAARRNIAASGFSGDMSGLWFDHLLPALREAPAALTGLTDAGALFCFEQLAWDVGMRVRLRIDHQAVPGGFRHVASAGLPSPVLAGIEAAGPTFGASAIDAALDCKAAWGNCTYAAAPARTAASSEALVTWVIAPLLFT